MTKAQIHQLINSFQNLKMMSLAIDDLESKIIAFLTVAQCQGKLVIIGGWEVFFDGQNLSISETPIVNKEQYGLARQGQQMFAVQTCSREKTEMGLSIGFRNSYDKSMEYVELLSFLHGGFEVHPCR